jgi:hypothetical protein
MLEPGEGRSAFWPRLLRINLPGVHVKQCTPNLLKVGVSSVLTLSSSTDCNERSDSP